MSRYKDFDLFFAERQRTPVTFSFAGRDYVLASELPAAVGLECARLKLAGRGDEDVPPSSLETMAKALLGQENFERLVSDGASLNQLGEILRWVMEEYQHGDHSDQPGNSPAPGQAGAAE